MSCGAAPKLVLRLQLTPQVPHVHAISAGVLCGAAASGQFTWTPEHVAQSALCMFMSGPLLTGYTQTINDYYDREIDAINEPYRPIPSGACRFVLARRDDSHCWLRRGHCAVISPIACHTIFARHWMSITSPDEHLGRLEGTAFFYALSGAVVDSRAV